MSVAQPLLDTIEPDEPLESSVNTKRPATAPVVLTPTNATQIQNDPEAGQSPVNRINPLTTNFLSQALWGYFDRYILISTTFHNFTAFILVGPSHGSLLLIPVPRSSYNRLYSMWMVYRQLCSFGTHPPPSLPIKLSFLVVDRCRGSPLSYGLLELPSEHAHMSTFPAVPQFPQQNVSGRTLVGLRFWNQVCPPRDYPIHFFPIVFFRSTKMARVIGYLKVET